MAVTRTITNVLPDGTMILYADPAAAVVIWQMTFSELSSADINALQSHFQSCYGPYRAFTFIDPTDNMLASSTNLISSSWASSPLIQIAAGATDPMGGATAFVLTNTSNSAQQLFQQTTVPANYQYCFSLYALSAQPSTIALFRRGASATANETMEIGNYWRRIVSTGRLNDPGTQLSVGVNLAPGQQVTLFGLQLEAQIQPSRYRATAGNGGIYPNSHWTSNRLPITSDAPDSFSAAFTIQSTL
ncbi:MAG TPA: hypothetical protein VFA65_16135 [Bryobacteraceae bacterium]|nr:hypothetical protein [Bryobacteraceae bacterium]